MFKTSPTKVARDLFIVNSFEKACREMNRTGNPVLLTDSAIVQEKAKGKKKHCTVAQ